jgi:hypothetical protein
VANDDPGFLRRWSRRKAAIRGDPARVEPLRDETAGAAIGIDVRDQTDRGDAKRIEATSTEAKHDEAKRDQAKRDEAKRDEAIGAATVRAPAPGTVATADTAAARSDRQPPTMADVAALTSQSDFSRFVGRHVGAGVRNAAMRKLFSDPAFNVMDGLDVYIDDYSNPEPLPATMARRLASARFMNLFDDGNDETASAAAATGENVVDVGAGVADAPPEAVAPATADQAPAPRDSAAAAADPPIEVARGDAAPPDPGSVTPSRIPAAIDPDPHST